MEKFTKVLIYVLASGSLSAVIEAVRGGLEEANVENFLLMGTLNLLLVLLVQARRYYRNKPL